MASISQPTDRTPRQLDLPLAIEDVPDIVRDHGLVETHSYPWASQGDPPLVRAARPYGRRLGPLRGAGAPQCHRADRSRSGLRHHGPRIPDRRPRLPPAGAELDHIVAQLRPRPRGVHTGPAGPADRRRPPAAAEIAGPHHRVLHRGLRRRHRLHRGADAQSDAFPLPRHHHLAPRPGLDARGAGRTHPARLAHPEKAGHHRRPQLHPCS